MDVFESIRERKSIRDYKETPVEFDKIMKVIDAGRLAPSAGNVQDWKFILVTDEDKKSKIAEVCSEQYWMETAPVHILVCAEPVKSDRMYGERGRQFYSIQNTAAAIENMLLASIALGLGSCWVGAFKEEFLRKIVEIPDNINPVAVVVLGYSKEKPKPQQKNTLQNVVFFNKWNNRVKDLAAAKGEYYKKVEALQKRLSGLMSLVKKKK